IHLYLNLTIQTCHISTTNLQFPTFHPVDAKKNSNRPPTLRHYSSTCQFYGMDQYSSKLVPTVFSSPGVLFSLSPAKSCFVVGLNEAESKFIKILPEIKQKKEPWRNSGCSQMNS
ncbi:unnamed protein product, partial [Caretta caretta]